MLVKSPTGRVKVAAAGATTSVSAVCLTLPDMAGVAQAGHFEGSWTLVYVGDGACDADCRAKRC